MRRNILVEYEIGFEWKQTEVGSKSDSSLLSIPPVEVADNYDGLQRELIFQIFLPIPSAQSSPRPTRHSIH